MLKLVQAVVAGYAGFTNERALRDVRGMVFIDEVESHLHLSWQSRIVRLLVELFPNTTFFVMTRRVLLDANALIYLFDAGSAGAPSERSRERLEEVLSDPDTELFVTPLVRYEAHRGARAPRCAAGRRARSDR